MRLATIVRAFGSTLLGAEVSVSARVTDLTALTEGEAGSSGEGAATVATTLVISGPRSAVKRNGTPTKGGHILAAATTASIPILLGPMSILRRRMEIDFIWNFGQRFVVFLGLKRPKTKDRTNQR